jgi:hypothetical protein
LDLRGRQNGPSLPNQEEANDKILLRRSFEAPILGPHWSSPDMPEGRWAIGVTLHRFSKLRAQAV